MPEAKERKYKLRILCQAKDIFQEESLQTNGSEGVGPQGRLSIPRDAALGRTREAL